MKLLPRKARTPRADNDDGETTSSRQRQLSLAGRGLGRAVAPARYADFLPEAQAIAAREHSPFARWLLVIVAAICVFALGWAAIAEVEQVATAEGRVRPDSRVKVINHPDGGRIEEIYVSEGERVSEGDPLVKFDAEFTREEVARLRSEWRSFAAEAARLDAEATGAEHVDFPEGLEGENLALVANQHDLFRNRRAALESRRKSAEDEIARRESEVASIEARIASLRDIVEIRTEQEISTRGATEAGYYSRLRYLAIKNELAEAQGRLGEKLDELAAKRSELAQARQERRRIDEEYNSEVFERLVQARQQRDSLGSELAQAQARFNRLVVRAPVDGVVQNISVTSIGQSVNDNEAMMNIVPTGDSLIIEARVSNDDIGAVSIGQEARIRVDAYDFVKFGTLDGEVIQIAADATEDPTRERPTFSYVVLIRTDRTHLGPEPGDQPVLPGMQVTADLKIGSRTVLSFLTDRITETTSTAFRE